MSDLKMVARQGNRPNTKKIEFGHDQLDNFSPAGYRDRIIEVISKLEGVVIGRSQVSEPSSVGFNLINGKGPKDAFLYDGVTEFAHIHTTGFLHISMPYEDLKPLIENGWAEFHPVINRPEFFNNLLMLYAPTNKQELEFVIDVIKISYHRALG